MILIKFNQAKKTNDTITIKLHNSDWAEEASEFWNQEF